MDPSVTLVKREKQQGRGDVAAGGAVKRRGDRRNPFILNGCTLRRGDGRDRGRRSKGPKVERRTWSESQHPHGTLLPPRPAAPGPGGPRPRGPSRAPAPRGWPRRPPPPPTPGRSEARPPRPAVGPPCPSPGTSRPGRSPQEPGDGALIFCPHCAPLPPSAHSKKHFLVSPGMALPCPGLPPRCGPARP